MMKRAWCCLLVLCCVALHGTNLLKEPLSISNAETTVYKDGVYTVTNPDVKTISFLYQDVELNQTEVKPLTFSVEAMAEENVGNTGCSFGMWLDLVYTDGTKQNCVNIGMGTDTFNWRMRCRSYLPKKPVKKLRYIIMYRKNKGKVHFRMPFLGEAVRIANIPRTAK